MPPATGEVSSCKKWQRVAAVRRARIIKALAADGTGCTLCARLDCIPQPIGRNPLGGGNAAVATQAVVSDGAARRGGQEFGFVYPYQVVAGTASTAS